MSLKWGTLNKTEYYIKVKNKMYKTPIQQFLCNRELIM